MSKASVIYDKFERHSHAEGLKGHATHYCPGCGHGLAHKFLAEAIDTLGIQDRTVAVSPVGCSVFLYYYFDVGNTQAAHGRAPAVALGHKFANPESVVISYQGDGDLASIGLAETISTAQLGAPITVIFINNAIYGMTGGQMAPTTLMGQSSTTSPSGRNQYNGQPMKMAEIIAGLDGPVYVERVALYDAKQRIKAKKAIQKAVQLQVEGRGYAFIEVLAECPTHLKMNPEETEKWVKECMEPVYPLGVKKDLTVDPWFKRNPPCFKGEKILSLAGATSEHPVRHCQGFPTHLAPHDISLKLAGSGGDVHVAEEEVLNPGSPDPQVLIAFNAPSLAKFGPTVRKGGYVIYDSSVVSEAPALDPSIKVFPVPFTGIATDLGKAVVKNIVALGALQAATGIFPKETMLSAIRVALKDKCALIPLNEEAFAWGIKSVEALAN
jgi:2-oxoisovalerate ferredoxin oxidoreductase beta subunit